MKRLILSTLGSLVLLSLSVVPTFAATTQDVDVTAQPIYVALTNSEGTWTIGNVAESATAWWAVGNVVPNPTTFEAADMMSTVENTGSVAEDVSIHSHNFTGGTVGWALGAAAGSDITQLSWGKTGGSTTTMTDFEDTTPVSFASNLAAAGTVKWCMRMNTPTVFSNGALKTSVVTLTAVAH